MDRAISTWLASPGSEAMKTQRAINPNLQADLKTLSKSHTIYGTLLLFPPKLHQSPWWQDHESQPDLTNLYTLLCTHLRVTHIAATPPIPPTTSSQPPTNHQNNNPTTQISNENFVRSPLNFYTLHGSFGPSTTANPTPDEKDFASAFWTTAKQNSLYQTWAPRWTMFSRGNISEKARLLTLPSVLRAVEEGKRGDRGCTAVDLYAGIGYFAFSYARAGVSRVLGWDVNGWSLEGLRRGARRNGFGVVDVVGREGGCDEGVLGQVAQRVEGEKKSVLVLFQESNEFALGRVEGARHLLPPVRHVNCGLLPTSRGCWGTALGVLDPEMGGWVHVHENFATVEIDDKAEEVRVAFQGLLGDWDGRNVIVERVHRVKSYAPGVMHCVIDLHVPPRSDDNTSVSTS